MYCGLKTWLVVTGIGIGLIVVPMAFITIRLWVFDRQLARMGRDLEQMSAQNAAAQKFASQANRENNSQLERIILKQAQCFRCREYRCKRDDGKRNDPHYPGLCLVCDGTGFYDPKKFKKVK